MNQFPTKKWLAEVLLTAVLCFALPAGAEEYILSEEQPAPQQETVIVEIPGVEEMREALQDAGTEAALNTNLAENYSTYAGEWDPMLGLPANDTESDSLNGMITLSPGVMEYNRMNQTYRLYCGDLYVTSSLPAGAVVNRNRPLQLEGGIGLVMELYRNGNSTAADGSITEPGNYVLYLNDNLGHSVAYGFTIVDRYVNNLESITLPEQFTFTAVTENEVEQTLQYINYYELVVECDYVLHWHCAANGDSYTTRFTLDRTPPQLPLTAVKNGIAGTGVSLEGLEEGAVVQVSHEGLETVLDDPGIVLSDPGRYTLTVIDQAGNRTVYSFRIKHYIDFKGSTALVLLLAALSVVVIYSRRLRSNPRYY